MAEGDVVSKGCRGKIEDIGNNQTLRCTHINTRTEARTDEKR